MEEHDMEKKEEAEGKMKKRRHERNNEKGK